MNPYQLIIQVLAFHSVMDGVSSIRLETAVISQMLLSLFYIYKENIIEQKMMRCQENWISSKKLPFPIIIYSAAQLALVN